MASLSSQTVVLNDGTKATIHPVWDGSELPLELVAALCVEYNAEIDRGRSFPETQKLLLETFEKSWFSGVAGVMIKGDDTSPSLLEDFDILDSHECFGSFWIQPCFPGRSSHICTANLLVKHRFRKHGVGTAMAQCFLRWAVQLGYDYALFNLVYDSNVAACRLLQRLGFRVLTVLRGAGMLKGFDRPVDAFVFGRSLLPGSGGTNATAPTQHALPATRSSSYSAHASAHPTHAMHSAHSSVSVQSSAVSTPGATPGTTPGMDAMPTAEAAVDTPSESSKDSSLESPGLPRTPLPEEYENVRGYLLTGEYPVHTTRVERTRIRSRARSYAVRDGVLLFKRTGQPVVASEADQVRITTEMHRENHNGINKLQKRIIQSYYWNGVRDTIVKVIRNCPECRAASTYRPGTIDPELEAAQPAATPAQASFNNFSPLAGSAAYLADPQDPGSIVYLPPENEDDEYIPEEDLDLGLDYDDVDYEEDDDDGE